MMAMVKRPCRSAGEEREETVAALCHVTVSTKTQMETLFAKQQTLELAVKEAHRATQTQEDRARTHAAALAATRQQLEEDAHRDEESGKDAHMHSDLPRDGAVEPRIPVPRAGGGPDPRIRPVLEEVSLQSCLHDHRRTAVAQHA
mmetsp:Transcript_29919/g.68658  ORF Transcript_29919/g.68658 Transcript_29919/m.68658 type:complete len:145 (-) Transcript_29919:309-743(-)